MTSFRHLKILITVAECGTMHSAAKKLYITQPSVSQAIRELEEAYQVRLFDRLGRHIYITEAGKLLLSYARQITETIDTMEEAMLQAAQVPIVRIGGSVTVGTVYLNRFISELEKKLPGIDIRVVIDNTSNIEELLLASRLDFAIVEGTMTHDELIQTNICEDELVMAVGHSHPFYSVSSLPLSRLSGQNLLSRESGSSDRNQFEQLLLEQNISMVRKWHCTNTEAIKQAAITGKGIALLSSSLIEAEVHSGDLKILPLENVKVLRHFKYVIHQNKILPEALSEAVSFLLPV